MGEYKLRNHLLVVAKCSAVLVALCIAAQADTVSASTPGTSAIEEFTVLETWTVLGGTGSGFIVINNFPPFASAEIQGDPDRDPDGAFAAAEFYAFGLSYQSQFPGVQLGEGAGIPFTFGVPFTFDSKVSLFAVGGLGGASATAIYGGGSGTYQIPAQFDQQASDPWGFVSADNPDLSSVTLERSAVLLPEPNLIWACLAGLVAIGIRKRKPA
jgi:hypothetical protein